MSKIKVIYKAPGEAPEIRTIKDNLKTLQDLVGGHIEIVAIERGVVMICNEEGKLLGLEPNFYAVEMNDVIVGPVVFVGTRGVDFADLPEYEQKIYMAQLGGRT